MKLANEIVSAWVSNPPTNARGYADGWKPPTLGERTVSVVQLADFLMVPEPQGKLVAPSTQPEQHLHRASCDDSGGNHICGFPPGPSIASW